MKTVLFSCFTWWAMTSVALAEPVAERISSSVALTEAQMDKVTAGALNVAATSWALGSSFSVSSSTSQATEAGVFSQGFAFSCCAADTPTDAAIPQNIRYQLQHAFGFARLVANYFNNSSRFF